ncbi:MAG TPA: hypothetical protein VLC28_01010 [Flavitalea sp.]|nr:hypothetical protein [Flavitalea sp.]
MIIFLRSAAVLFFAFTLMPGCRQQQPSAELATGDTAEIKEFFPVYDFLSTEISSVDSLPVGLKYYQTINQHTDSGYISHADFDKLASLFTPADIRGDKFQTGFKENSFYDRSSKTSTFMYQPLESANPVKRIDILTKATDTYDKVTSIYMESQNTFADSSVSNKMMWKTGRYMQLNQQVTYTGKPAVKRQIKVVWNNWEETP